MKHSKDPFGPRPFNNPFDPESLKNPSIPDTSVHTIDRREFMKKALVVGVGGTLIAASLYYIHNRIPFPIIPFDKVSRTLGGEEAEAIPDSWLRTLERVRVDSTELSKADIDTLTNHMQPIDYSRVCNSNPSLAMPTTKYGMSLTDAMDYMGKGHISNSGMLEIGATDWYTLVTYPGDEKYDHKKGYLSVSKNNIPKEFRSGSNFERARKAKITYSGVFFPEEDAQAWKDLVDVNSISPLLEEVKPGTYFRGPYGEIIMPEHKDVSMNLDDLVLTLDRPGELPLRIYYYDFREIAENNFIMYENQAYPYISIKDILEYWQIEDKNIALIFHANNYSVSIPPWRQDKKLGIIFDSKFEETRGVPTKLIGGEFLNKAAQVNGVYRIEAIPM